MTPVSLLPLLASPVLAAALAKGWQWWTTRDAAKLAAAAKAAETQAAHDAAKISASAAERADVVALLRQQLVAGDERAERSAARATEIAAALAASAHATTANTAAIESLRVAITAYAAEELDILRDLHAMLPPPSTREQPRASMVPSAMRAPTPPLPAIPAPRRSP